MVLCTQAPSVTQQHAAVLVQTAWRKHTARARFVTISHACQRIQSGWRAHHAGQAVRAQLWEAHLPAAKIPTHWHCSKQHQRLWSVLPKVVRLQAAVRCFLLRRQFQQTRRSCLVIQAAWRASAAARATRLHLQTQHCAAACIQARWRGSRQHRQFQRILSSRLHLQAQHCAATRIQARWRGSRQCRQFQLTVVQVILVQSIFRCRSARKAYLRTKSAVTVIQLAWRARQSRMLLRSAPSMSALKNCMLGLQSAVDCDWHSAVDDSRG